MTDLNIDTVQLGDECYHKATNKKCVILSVVDKEKKLVNVRDSDNEEHEYYSYELRLPVQHKTPSWAGRNLY